VITGGPFTVRVSVLEAVAEVESVTWTVKVKAPTDVGVPEIVPTFAFNESPVGSVPNGIDQLYGVVPLLAAKVAVYVEF